LAKTVLAFVSGGTAYGWRVAVGLTSAPLVFAVIVVLSRSW
jgi:hypothetical protein